MIVKDLIITKDFRSYGRVGFLAGRLGRVVAVKYPKYHYFIVKIEKILGISVVIATVSPWISNK